MPNGQWCSTSRRALRYRLTLILRRAGHPMTIRQLVAAVEQAGWPAPEPANKTVSDSLRWELGHGRVVRVARGTYSLGRLDRRTAWFMQRKLDEWDEVERLRESQRECELPGPLPSALEAHAVPDWLAALRPEA